MRVVISEKFVEIFGWYENDLDMVQQLYEKHKVCFYMFDNMCPLNVLQLTIKYYGKDIKKKLTNDTSCRGISHTPITTKAEAILKAD